MLWNSIKPGKLFFHLKRSILLVMSGFTKLSINLMALLKDIKPG